LLPNATIYNDFFETFINKISAPIHATNNGDYMGRIKTKLVKRVTRDLIAEHREKFSTDYEENKKAVSGLAEIQSKKVRNTIAGYITKSIKKG